MEQDYPDKHKSFKAIVMSKIIREVDDCKDIKITIHSTLNEFMNEFDLIGWVRNSNESDTIPLLKENSSLNKQIKKLQEQLNVISKEQFGNYTFYELVDILKNKHFSSEPYFYEQSYFPFKKISGLEYFTSYYNEFCSTNGHESIIIYECCKFLEALNLIEAKSKTIENVINEEIYIRHCFKISKQGVIFMMMLEKSDVIKNMIL